MLDLTLAVAHHLLIFGIFGIFCVEFWAVRPGLSAVTVRRVASMDFWYGVLAAAIIVIGFCRAIFAAKGWAYYSYNGFFWAKIGTFVAVGLLSIPPIAFLRWRKSAVLPTDSDIKSVRRYLHMVVVRFSAYLCRRHGARARIIL